MYNDIQSWVSTCVDCALKKGDPKSKLGKYSQIHTEKPLDLIATDIMGPLPQTEKGNKYIILFMDHFSRWIEAIAAKSTDSKTLANKFIKHIICKHGTPKQLLSDCGSNYTSILLKDVMETLQVQHLKTATYHHQSNGMVEHMAKTLESMLAMYVNYHQSDWDTLLPYTAFTYNTTINDTTGQIPFKVIYGREPSFPDDIVEHMDQSGPVQKYTENVVAKLQQVYQEVQKFTQDI